MSGTRTAERPTINEFGDRFGDPTPTQEASPALMPMTPGSRTDQAMAQVITAQRVGIKRNLPAILKEIDETAAVGADKMYYEWSTKNRDGTTGSVVGPSIKCAMAVVNIWGNCAVEAFPAQETATHWTFLARFVDYEKGVTVSRSYQQRKSQRAGGRMDADRQMDIAFAIGQSKAIRNVVVAALSFNIDRAVEAARSSAFRWVEGNLEKAKRVVLDQAEKLRIPLERMQTAVGRPEGRWVARDLLALRGKLQSIEDGFDDLDSAFPLPGEDDEQEAEQKPSVTAKPTQQQTQQPQEGKQQPDAKPRRQTKPASSEKSVQQETSDRKPKEEPSSERQTKAPVETKQEQDQQEAEVETNEAEDPSDDNGEADDTGTQDGGDDDDDGLNFG